jgi:hypothetical protein
VKRLFLLYQLVAAFVLLPLAYLVWFRSLGDHRVTALIVFLPALFSYLNSGFAANVTKLFEFKAQVSLGGILILHGFVFAGGSAFLLFGSLSAVGASGPLAVLRTAVCGVGVFGLANWLFDTLLIRSGLVIIRNKPAAEGASPAVIAADYVPVYLGSFGACYSVSAALAQELLLAPGHLASFPWFAAAATLGTIAVPIGAFVLFSFLRHGYSGLVPYPGAEEARRGRHPASRQRSAQRGRHP